MIKRLAAAALLNLSAAVACALGQVPSPMPDTYVHDFAGVIAPDRRAEIQAKAERLKREFTTEIAVVTVDSLGGATPFDYSMKMAKSWGIGDPDEESRGLLLLVAVKDRSTSFRTSRHTEGELPDGVVGSINRSMRDHFRRGDFGGGLSAGMDKVIERVQAEYEAPRPAATSAPQGAAPATRRRLWPLLILLLPLAVLAWLVFRPRKQRGRMLSDNAIPATPTTPLAVLTMRPSRVAPAPRGSVGTRPPARPKPQPPPPPQRARPRRERDDDDSGGGIFGAPASSGFSTSARDDDDDRRTSVTARSDDDDKGSDYGGASDFGGGGQDDTW